MADDAELARTLIQALRRIEADAEGALQHSRSSDIDLPALDGERGTD